jgi:hypothetical protein
LFIERLFKPLNGIAAFRPLPAMPVAGIGGGRIIITSGPNRGHKGELLRDSEGHPDYLRIGHRPYRRDI